MYDLIIYQFPPSLPVHKQATRQFSLNCARGSIHEVVHRVQVTHAVISVPFFPHFVSLAKLCPHQDLGIMVV